MKKIFFFLLSSVFVLFSCKKEPKYYNSKLYPVIKDGYAWVNNEIFNNVPISIKLESRIKYEEASYEGRFEPINKTDAVLKTDKDIYILSDTIKKNTDLLKYDFVEIETYKVQRNGEYVDNCYIIWLNKDNDTNFYVNKGYYTLYFSTNTEHNYQINDSTVIKIN